MNKKNIIPYIGLLACCLYFITTAGLIITGSPGFLTAMELATALSSPVLLLIFISIPSASAGGTNTGRLLSIVFMSCCMLLTSTVHFLNITVTQPLISAGVQVPSFLQVGKWPSVPMAADYLGWGFFMGAAFISASCALSHGVRKLRGLKYTLYTCGVLCFLGLLGVSLFGENFWYIAPIGYGPGTVVVCVEMILGNRAEGRRGGGIWY